METLFMLSYLVTGVTYARKLFIKSASDHLKINFKDFSIPKSPEGPVL